MQQVLDHIEALRLKFAKHPFFTELLNNTSLTGRQRLSWAPMFVPFVMGYSDLNSCVFRNEENNDDPLQRELNYHTYEEDFHWQWMLDDMDRLGWNPQYSMTDAARIYWGKKWQGSRRVCLESAALATRTGPHGVFAIVEVIEACSVTLFRACCGIEIDPDVECVFFGTHHYNAEAAHLIKSDESKGTELILTEEQRTEAKDFAEKTFAIYSKWFMEMKEFAEAHNNNMLETFDDMLQYSKAMPREAVFPDYLSK